MAHSSNAFCCCLFFLFFALHSIFVHLLFTAFTTLSWIASEICLLLVWYYLNIPFVWHRSHQRTHWSIGSSVLGVYFSWLNDSNLNFDVTIPLLPTASERETCAYLNAFLLLLIHKENNLYFCFVFSFLFCHFSFHIFLLLDCHRLSVIWATKNYYCINYHVIRFPCKSHY